MVLVGLVLAMAAHLAAAPATLTVAVDKPGHTISPLLYGIFFEDINCSADGGIYAEMVRNRNFEDSDKPDHWSVAASGPANFEGRAHLPPGVADWGGHPGIVWTGGSFAAIFVAQVRLLCQDYPCPNIGGMGS